ncbi:ABC-type multidrug transport system, ATPase and permease component [Desulfocurvibacter africanus PCS]|uniref:ABC-type multidrug transport system, ATPase and permease component n=1 Tax=Desulfocurvibacter africanus PCS TaxID=1262666 RepID=M5PX30_DESAF|nr:ABC transporter ATP-binding protein [Desulfocurvibacter africanus]EMG38609.1 ABC-type multidrug transport system, ATPase and permease component [Desulfocurvibacter africanus PCS]
MRKPQSFPLIRLLRNLHFFQHLRASWLLVFGVCLALAGQSGLILALPWPFRQIVDHLVQQKATGQDATTAQGLGEFARNALHSLQTTQTADIILISAALLLFLYVSNALLMYLQHYFLVRLGQSVVLSVRRELFTRIITMPAGFFATARSGDLTSRITSDSAEIETILEAIVVVTVRSLPTIIGILLVTFLTDWVFALTFVLAVPLIFLANTGLAQKAKKSIRQQRRIEGGIASSVQESISHQKAVSAMCLEEGLVQEFARSGQESVALAQRAGHYQGMLTSAVDLLIGLTTVLVILVGALRILEGSLTVGQFMVFMAYLNSLFKPVREVSKFASRMSKSTASLERVEEILQLDPRRMGAVEQPDSVPAPALQGAIQLSGVTFGYDPESPVLRDLSLVIPAGKTVALAGGSGSGKSTILQLLLRMYDPQNGSVRIGGQDIRRFTLESLRSQMATVLQDSFLFNLTIRENIRLARPDASDEEVERAAKAAEAHEFIFNLPLGYDTPLGEGGTGLSGGQKRRLAIARAFLKDAPIVLLDEPTTGLDSATERDVITALKRLCSGRTGIIVTHQLSTVTDVDEIYFLQDGIIVEQGSHKELLSRQGPYRSMWVSQAS